MKQNNNQMPQSAHPSALIQKLCEFYNANPNYETSITDIAVLIRLAHTKMNKFVRRPHKQVTEIFFDGEMPHCFAV